MIRFDCFINGRKVRTKRLDIAKAISSIVFMVVLDGSDVVSIKKV